MKTNPGKTTSAQPVCTVTLVFAKDDKANVRRQIAEMLLNIWLQKAKQDMAKETVPKKS